MTRRSDTLVFVPALNEEESLPAVLDELAAELAHVDVLVVDDGSIDATAAVARARGAQVLSFGEKTGIHMIRIGEFEIPTDGAGRMWLHFTPHEPRRYLPAWRVLDGSFDPALVAGQIVFIGTSASGLHDIRATPLDSSIPGVEIHAQAIEQAIAGDFLNRPSFADAVELAHMLALGLLLVWMLPRFGPIAAFVIGATCRSGGSGPRRTHASVADPARPWACAARSNDIQSQGS